MTDWTFEDGWILAATSLAQKPGGAALADVIAVADMINHAIPTAEELSQTYSRLAACGLLRAEDQRYAVPDVHLSAIKATLVTQESMFDYGRTCLGWLKDGQFDGTEQTGVSVSDSEVAAAYADYLAMFNTATSMGNAKAMSRWKGLAYYFSRFINRGR